MTTCLGLAGVPKQKDAFCSRLIKVICKRHLGLKLIIFLKFGCANYDYHHIPPHTVSQFCTFTNFATKLLFILYNVLISLPQLYFINWLGVAKTRMLETTESADTTTYVKPAHLQATISRLVRGEGNA